MRVNGWDWVHNFRQQAIQKGDRVRLQLPDLLDRAIALFEVNPTEAEIMLAQGRVIAEHLGEKFWVLLYDNWAAMLQTFQRRNFTAALAIVVRNTVEARKPEYQDFPFLSEIARALIDVYTEVDPIGYADKIREVIFYIENEIPLLQETWTLMPSQYAFLSVAFEQWDEAMEHALRYLQRADDDSYHTSWASLLLCSISFRRGQFDELAGYAALGQPHARRFFRMKIVLASLICWQAFCACKNGEIDAARRFYRIAVGHIEEQHSTLNEYYYDAACAYLEADNQLDHAVTLRTQETLEAAQSGSPHKECESRIKRCQLLKQMGLLTDNDLLEARIAARGLLDPSRFLSRLAQIT